MKVTVVMPCLNEAETLRECILKVKRFFDRSTIEGEIIVADNGSTDGSIAIAESEGVTIVHVPVKGYGSALRNGIKAAAHPYIIMGDSDDSHDLENLDAFVEALQQGAALVIGNRFKGGLSKKDMSPLHRYVGNPILTGLGNLFFKTNIGDFHCGLRGFTKSAFETMELTTDGMEFASEMIVKAKLNQLQIVEVPTKVFPSGRSRAPHLNTWKDGWRHLRFLLLYSPKWLFFLPGLVMMIAGLLLVGYHFVSEGLLPEQLLLSCGTLLTGFQLVLFYGLTKIYAAEHKLYPKSDRYDNLFKYVTLEKGLLLGVFITLLGALGLLLVFVFPSVIGIEKLAGTIISVTMMLFGVQVILFSLFFSILGLKNK